MVEKDHAVSLMMHKDMMQQNCQCVPGMRDDTTTFSSIKWK